MIKEMIIDIDDKLETHQELIGKGSREYVKDV